MSKDQILQIIQQEKPFLAKQYHVSDIGIFGSVSRGEDRNDSDVDVLVKFSEGSTVGLFAYTQMAQYLESKLKRKVDLLTPNSIRPAFREYILPNVLYV